MLSITNKRICEFYKKNTQLDIESINLFLLDLIEKTVDNVKLSDNVENITTYSNITSSPFSNITSSPFSNITSSSCLKIDYQTAELANSFITMKKALVDYNKIIVLRIVDAKNDYITEFATNLRENNKQHMMNNVEFIKKIDHILFVSVMKKNVCMNKINEIVRQFKRMLDENTNSLLNGIGGVTIDNMDSVLSDYCENIEMNIASFSQSVCQIWQTWMENKEKEIYDICKGGEGNVNVNGEYKGNILRLYYEVNEMTQYFTFHKSILESNKGVELENVLIKLFSVSSVSKEADNENIIYRENMPTVYIYNVCNAERNVNLDEIKEYNKKCKQNNCNGILISWETGITMKQDFAIEMTENGVLLYLHKMKGNSDKLKMAFELVDSLQNKLNELREIDSNNMNNGQTKLLIPKEILDDINREYQSFIVQKEAVLDFVKETNKKLLSQIDNIKFISLDKYLSTKYISTKKQGYVCDLCRNFTVGTLKGLAAHKRGCSRKLGVVLQKSGGNSLLNQDGFDENNINELDKSLKSSSNSLFNNNDLYCAESL